MTCFFVLYLFVETFSVIFLFENIAVPWLAVFAIEHFLGLVWWINQEIMWAITSQPLLLLSLWQIHVSLTVRPGATAQPITIDKCYMGVFIYDNLLIFSVLNEWWLQCLFLWTVYFLQLLSALLLYSSVVLCEV